MAETSDKLPVEFERELGLSPGLIRKWQQRYRVRDDTMIERFFATLKTECIDRRYGRDNSLSTKCSSVRPTD